MLDGQGRARIVDVAEVGDRTPSLVHDEAREEPGLAFMLSPPRHRPRPSPRRSACSGPSSGPTTAPRPPASSPPPRSSQGDLEPRCSTPARPGRSRDPARISGPGLRGGATRRHPRRSGPAAVAGWAPPTTSRHRRPSTRGRLRRARRWPSPRSAPTSPSTAPRSRAALRRYIGRARLDLRGAACAPPRVVPSVPRAPTRPTRGPGRDRPLPAVGLGHRLARPASPALIDHYRVAVGGGQRPLACWSPAWRALRAAAGPLVLDRATAHPGSGSSPARWATSARRVRVLRRQQAVGVRPGHRTSFGFNRTHGPSTSCRDELLGMVADIASKGGNLLLNVGPGARTPPSPTSSSAARPGWGCTWVRRSTSLLTRTRPWILSVRHDAEGHDLRSTARAGRVRARAGRRVRRPPSPASSRRPTTPRSTAADRPAPGGVLREAIDLQVAAAPLVLDATTPGGGTAPPATAGR